MRLFAVPNVGDLPPQDVWHTNETCCTNHVVRYMAATPGKLLGIDEFAANPDIVKALQHLFQNAIAFETALAMYGYPMANVPLLASRDLVAYRQRVATAARMHSHGKNEASASFDDDGSDARRGMQDAAGANAAALAGEAGDADSASVSNASGDESAELDLKCKICNDSPYENAALLALHMRSHDRPGRHFCPHGCRGEFRTRRLMYDHVWEQHAARFTVPEPCKAHFVADDDLMCPQCGKIFTAVRHRARHEQSHVEQPLIRCPFGCPRGFLATHMRFHTATDDCMRSRPIDE